MSIKSKIKKVKGKVIDKTSDFIANNFMGGNKAKKEIAKVDSYIKDKNLVRETKGVELINDDYTDPIFRARANVSNFETEYAQKMNKKYPKRY